MEMKNVLDQLKTIAEDNDSEDIARAIETADKYSFKDRLKEAEDASVYGQEDIDDFMGGPDETTIGKKVDETPGDDDDQYCATCGNTGERLDQADTPCPNCTDDEGEGGADDAFDRISDRVDARGGNEDGLGDDPWGIGDGDDAEVEEDSAQAGAGALDRVVDRSHRAGDGGPIDRVQTRHSERRAALEEELGMVFQTPMERHSWIMNQLNDIAKQLDPEDAAMVKSILKKAGNADVKGGNC